MKKGQGVYNVAVIGAGTAGLVTAAGTAGLGGRVALIERNLMGGDCLNFGCVPSKALLAASHAATPRSGAWIDNSRSSHSKESLSECDHVAPKSRRTIPRNASSH